MSTASHASVSSCAKHSYLTLNISAAEVASGLSHMQLLLLLLSAC